MPADPIKIYPSREFEEKVTRLQEILQYGGPPGNSVKEFCRLTTSARNPAELVYLKNSIPVGTLVKQSSKGATSLDRLQATWASIGAVSSVTKDVGLARLNWSLDQRHLEIGEDTKSGADDSAESETNVVAKNLVSMFGKLELGNL